MFRSHHFSLLLAHVSNQPLNGAVQARGACLCSLWSSMWWTGWDTITGSHPYHENVIDKLITNFRSCCIEVVCVAQACPTRRGIQRLVNKRLVTWWSRAVNAGWADTVLHRQSGKFHMTFFCWRPCNSVSERHRASANKQTKIKRVWHTKWSKEACCTARANKISAPFFSMRLTFAWNCPATLI